MLVSVVPLSPKLKLTRKCCRQESLLEIPDGDRRGLPYSIHDSIHCRSSHFACPTVSLQHDDDSEWPITCSLMAAQWGWQLTYFSYRRYSVLCTGWQESRLFGFQSVVRFYYSQQPVRYCNGKLTAFCRLNTFTTFLFIYTTLKMKAVS